MKHFALLIAAAQLVLAPQALRAHDYEDATMRFTVPDDYTYQPLDDTTQGITGFTAISLGVCVSSFDGPDSDSSGDDGDTGGGYDGTGTTIHYDV